MAERWNVAGVVVAMVLLGAASSAVAGRVQACRNTCRDVIAVECGERLGLARPERRCRRDLLKTCKHEGVATCTYPILVGSWHYELASCVRTCPDVDPEDCRSDHYTTFTFLQKGTRLEETSRSMTGFFTDHASFALSARDVLGNTVTVTGTMISPTVITNVMYEADSTSADLGACHISQLGQLVRLR